MFIALSVGVSRASLVFHLVMKASRVATDRTAAKKKKEKKKKKWPPTTNFRWATNQKERATRKQMQTNYLGMLFDVAVLTMAAASLRTSPPKQKKKNKRTKKKQKKGR